jgi:hypothetical protein
MIRVCGQLFEQAGQRTTDNWQRTQYMNQPPQNPPSPGRWLRLALLIASVGALSLIGAALGRGLDIFDSSYVNPIGTPTALAVVPAPAVSAAEAAAAPLADAPTALPASAVPAPPARTQPRPTAPAATPTLAAQSAQAAGGSLRPRQLPRTSGGETSPLAVLPLALFAIGLALAAIPRIIDRKRDTKE